MLKTLSKRKMVLTLLAVMVLIASLGAVYAWFTAKVTSNQNVSMGHLSINAEFEALGGPIEPGITTELQGIVKNTGSIGVLIKMNLKATSTIKWDTYFDEDGLELLDKWRTEPYIIEKDPNIKLTAPQFNSEVLDSDFDDATGDFYIWMKDKNADDYYLLIEGNTFDVGVIYGLEFEGSAMGNKYQDADIVFANKLVGTQWWADGALQQQFGISFDDLENYPDHSGSRSAFGSNTKTDKIMQRITEIRQERK